MIDLLGTLEQWKRREKFVVGKKFAADGKFGCKIEKFPTSTSLTYQVLRKKYPYERKFLRFLPLMDRGICMDKVTVSIRQIGVASFYALLTSSKGT